MESRIYASRYQGLRAHPRPQGGAASRRAQAQERGGTGRSLSMAELLHVRPTDSSVPNPH